MVLVVVVPTITSAPCLSMVASVLQLIRGSQTTRDKSRVSAPPDTRPDDGSPRAVPVYRPQKLGRIKLMIRSTPSREKKCGFIPGPPNTDT